MKRHYLLLFCKFNENITSLTVNDAFHAGQLPAKYGKVETRNTYITFKYTLCISTRAHVYTTHAEKIANVYPYTRQINEGKKIMQLKGRDDAHFVRSLSFEGTSQMFSISNARY